MRSIFEKIKEWKDRNKPKYSIMIGGPRSFAPGAFSNGSDYNSAVVLGSNDEYLGKELSDEVRREATKLRMSLGPKVKNSGKGDLIVRLEVYNPK